MVCALFWGLVCQSHDLPFEGSSCSRQCVAREKAFFAIYWAFFPALRLANDDFPETAVWAQCCLAEAVNKGPLRSASSRARDVTWHDMTARPCDRGTSFPFPHGDPVSADWPPLHAQVLRHCGTSAHQPAKRPSASSCRGQRGIQVTPSACSRCQGQGEACKLLSVRTVVFMLLLPMFSILKAL